MISSSSTGCVQLLKSAGLRRVITGSASSQLKPRKLVTRSAAAPQLSLMAVSLAVLQDRK